MLTFFIFFHISSRIRLNEDLVVQLEAGLLNGKEMLELHLLGHRCRVMFHHWGQTNPFALCLENNSTRRFWWEKSRSILPTAVFSTPWSCKTRLNSWAETILSWQIESVAKSSLFIAYGRYNATAVGLKVGYPWALSCGLTRMWTIWHSHIVRLFHCIIKS